jgi:hypothetical protein
MAAVEKVATTATRGRVQRRRDTMATPSKKEIDLAGRFHPLGHVMDEWNDTRFQLRFASGTLRRANM